MHGFDFIKKTIFIPLGKLAERAICFAEVFLYFLLYFHFFDNLHSPAAGSNN